MQEGQCVVPQESNIGVVSERREIEGVPEERSEEITAAGEEG